jgi:hypothetical protein
MILEINTKTLDQKFFAIFNIYSQNIVWVPKKFLLSSLTSSQIWLNPLVDDGQVHVSHKIDKKALELCPPIVGKMSAIVG